MGGKVCVSIYKKQALVVGQGLHPMSCPFPPLEELRSNSFEELQPLLTLKNKTFSLTYVELKKKAQWKFRKNIYITFNIPRQKYGHPYAWKIALRKDGLLQKSLCWASQELNSLSWQEEGSISVGKESKSSKSSCFVTPCCIAEPIDLNVNVFHQLWVFPFWQRDKSIYWHPENKWVMK